MPSKADISVLDKLTKNERCYNEFVLIILYFQVLLYNIVIKFISVMGIFTLMTFAFKYM